MILFPRIADGSLLCVLEGHTGSVYRVAFSFDDTLLASASRDGTVRLWGVGGLGTTEPLRTLNRLKNVVRSVALPTKYPV